MGVFMMDISQDSMLFSGMNKKNQAATDNAVDEYHIQEQKVQKQNFAVDSIEASARVPEKACTAH